MISSAALFDIGQPNPTIEHFQFRRRLPSLYNPSERKMISS